MKNQNPYGTCWAHATCASLESWLLKSESSTFDFSENNMANLHGGDWGFNDGGNGDRASAYLLRWGGPVLESDDPNPGSRAAARPSRNCAKVARNGRIGRDAPRRIRIRACFATGFVAAQFVIRGSEEPRTTNRERT